MKSEYLAGQLYFGILVLVNFLFQMVLYPLCNVLKVYARVSAKKQGHLLLNIVKIVEEVGCNFFLWREILGRLP